MGERHGVRRHLCQRWPRCRNGGTRAPPSCRTARVAYARSAARATTRCGGEPRQTVASPERRHHRLPDPVGPRAWRLQLAAFVAPPWPTIIVSSELGWSLVPPEPLARRFRDLAGTLAQLTAAAADEVWLMVGGCPLKIKSASG